MTERRKKVIDYIMTGGIRNRYFVYNEQSGNLQIYQIRGHSGIDSSIPSNLWIDVCIYRINQNKVHRYNKSLECLLEDEEATKEQVELIPSQLKSDARNLHKSKEFD